MDRIEYKEGIIFCNGSRAGTALETVVLVLSATGSKTISETCDLLNQLMQSFDDTVASLKDLAEEVEEILKFYRYIDLDIKVASEWLEQYEAGYNPLGAVVYDGMPHGNNLSDSTALLAVKLAGTKPRVSARTASPLYL